MQTTQTLVADYVDTMFSLFPNFATQLGVHDHDGELDSYAKESRQQIQNTLTRFSTEFSKINVNQLSAADALDVSLIQNEILGYRMSLEEYKSWQIDPCTYPETALYGIYMLVGKNGPPWEERVEPLLSRMKKIEGLFEEAKANLKNPPKLFTESAIEVTEAGKAFFETLKIEAFPISEKQKERLKQVNDRVVTLFQEYGDWLKTELLARSNGSYAIGKDFFDRQVKEYHLLPYSTTDLKAIGEENLQNTLREIEVVAQKIDPNKTWVELLRESSKRHPTCESLVSIYRQVTEKTTRFIREKDLAPFPKVDEIEVLETPPFARSFLPFAAYMPAPPFWPTGQGEFWVTPAESDFELQEHAYHKIPIIVAHETYPGHHLQFSFLREAKSPLVKRSFSTVSCEGWAFYCEQMMQEQGYYDDPFSHLCQLKDQLWRVVRVILDVGLHTGEMSLEHAVRFLMENVLLPEAMAQGEVKRYVRFATQPMSYFIGKWEILKLRDAYRKLKGDRFSLNAFHGEFLKCGVVPVKLASEQLLK